MSLAAKRPASVLLTTTLFLFGLVALAPDVRAGGTFITVETSLDELNANEVCSLREAIQAANEDTAVDACPAGAGTDTIELPAETGPFLLTIGNVGLDEDANQTGDLDITENVNIQAMGARAVIDGGAEVANPEVDLSCGNAFSKGFDPGNDDRILEILGADVDLTGLDITGGHIDQDGSSSQFAEGGGIFVAFNSSAHLTDTRVYGNFGRAVGDEFSSSSGGGIRSEGILTLSEDSRVTDNALQAQFTDGGGISSVLFSIGFAGDSGPQGGPQVLLDIDASRVNGNVICGQFSGGGGISTNVTSLIRDTRVANNSIDSEESDGGGIAFSNNELTPQNALLRVEVENNTTIGSSGNRGGGIWSNAPLEMDRSTVDGNSAHQTFDGGTEGGGMWSAHTLNMVRSTVSDNTVLEGSDLRSTPQGSSSQDGGGLFSFGGTTDITNSTFARNEAQRGGGIFSDSDQTPFRLTHVTISRNSANEGGGLYSIGGEGTVDPLATIIGDNDQEDCGPGSGTIDSSNWNLDSDDTCDFTRPNDLENTNPQLNNLGDNGGPTQTMRPQNDSPVIDHVGPEIPKQQEGCPPPNIDQRGVNRPLNGDGQGGARCDIGAVEIAPVAVPKCPGFENDPRNQIVGTHQVDNLVGTGGDDIICGRRADDTIKGNGGDDLILGGPGADDIQGNNGKDRIRAQDGQDNVAGNDGDDHVNLGSGDDVGNMGPGNDNVQGHRGDDVINGQGGDDNELRGERGEDKINGGLGNDKIGGNLHDDILKGEEGNDYIVGGRGGDDMRGGPNTDKCRGGGQADDSFDSCEDAA